MKRMLFAGLFFVATSASAVIADESVETVVVTGSRMPEDAEYNPHITLTQRADHLITKVRVECDTRDPTKRKEELRQTLRSMLAEAKGSKSISLSVGDEILVAFTEKMLDKVIVPESKADTSEARVVIRTELTKDDTFDDATQRIKDYVASTPKAGRTEILINDQFNLGLVAPERYRAQLIDRIAADAKLTALQFGTGYDARLEGMQHTIEWYQVGPLDLALYIPYKLAIATHGAQ